jgi:ABC-type glycerol-3-phosphate transport system permease component
LHNGYTLILTSLLSHNRSVLTIICFKLLYVIIKKIKNYEKLLKIAGYIILILGALSMIMPFLWMVMLSLMSNEQIFSYPPSLIPKPLIFDNYINVFNSIALKRYFFNSFFVSTLTTIGRF